MGKTSEGRIMTDEMRHASPEEHHRILMQDNEHREKRLGNSWRVIKDFYHGDHAKAAKLFTRLGGLLSDWEEAKVEFSKDTERILLRIGDDIVKDCQRKGLLPEGI